MHKTSKWLVLPFIFMAVNSFTQPAKELWLDELDIQSFSEGIRPVTAKRNYAGDSMRINGVYYQRGIGGQTINVLSFYLNKKARRFQAVVGADDQGNKTIPVKFYVLGDGKILFESGDMHVGDAAKPVDVDLTGIVQLGLLVTDEVGGVNNKRTYCNWADVRLQMLGDALPGHIANNGKKYILTPAPSRKPAIHSAALFGATPGNPFLYTIAATGSRPMQFSAAHLPDSLHVDLNTGIISGNVRWKGEYTVVLKAKNRFGEDTKQLRILIGDTIALTPPMGWNGFNAWTDHIDKEKVMASAHAMVSSGLRDHGWVYINIDDAWQGQRGGALNALQANEKFPDIKQMVADIHAMGLKAGIYSTPYISSYGGYPGASSDSPDGKQTHASIMVNRKAFTHIGKYRFETNDALQMADWGFDFLKYDWRIDVNSAERMQAALKQSGRDIVFSLSNNAPFEKVNDWIRTSNLYRTGPDIRDSWTSLYLVSFSLDKWSPYGGHGHWNDPDMMIVGNVATGSQLHPTRLTPDEQYSHVSMFSLLAAPMLVGCPLEQLDAFTLNLLSNDEIIAINQDPLGQPARLLAGKNGVQIWVKPMEDGSYAVGLFNTDGYGATPASYFRWGNEKAKSFVFDFASAGLPGKWRLRDAWRQKDLGSFTGKYATTIPYHGVVVLRMRPGK